jgi:hypothetical protein
MIGKSKRLIFVSALALSILATSAYGVQSAFAQDTTTQSTIVQKIAEKFSLKPEEVQAVFDQQHEARKAAMEAKFEQVLTEAVQKGELTEEKKQLILAKHREIRAMSKSKLRSELTTHKADLKKWAEENDIDLKYFLGGKGHGRLMHWKK